jgi:RNA polymerase sigma-70 factor (ECF subfamily)
MWFSGRTAIAKFLGGMLASLGAQRLVAVEASGLSGFAMYVRAPGEALFRAQGIQVVAVERGRAAPSVARVDAFLDPTLFSRFGLPESVR